MFAKISSQNEPENVYPLLTHMHFDLGGVKGQMTAGVDNYPCKIHTWIVIDTPLNLILFLNICDLFKAVKIFLHDIKIIIIYKIGLIFREHAVIQFSK